MSAIQNLAKDFGTTSRIGNAIFLDAEWDACAAFLRKASEITEWDFAFHCGGDKSWVRVPDHV